MKSSFLKGGLIIGTVLASVAICDNASAQDLASAKLLTSGEQYEQSETMLNQLISADPSNSKNYFYLGENYLLDYFSDTISNSIIEFTDKAKATFEKGIQANAGDPLNYVGLAKVANYLNDAATAEEMRIKAKSCLLPYKKVNKKMVPAPKDYAFALAKIADSYLLNNDVDTSKALPLIRQAMTIDKTNPEIYLIAGDIYIAVNDGSNAISNYRTAEYYDPTSPAANMKMGNIYVKGKSLTAAMPYYEAAIALDANFAPAYRELGQLYWTAQRLEQSKTYYQKYLELTQGNIPAKILYVNSLFYAKDYDGVIKNVEEILQIDNSRSYLNRLVGYSYFDRKNPDYDQAYNYMNRLFEVAPERILWKDNYYMAKIIIKQNADYTRTVNELNAAKTQLANQQSKYNSANSTEKARLQSDLDAAKVKVTELQAKVDNANKQLDRAFSEYNKVLASKPEEKALRNEVATQYYTFQRYDKAAKMWASILDPATATPENYMQVGRAFYAGDFNKSADSVFNIVIAKQADYLPAYVYSARTATKMDPEYKLGLAKSKFEKVISVAKTDSVANVAEMMEAFSYLGYYHSTNGNYNDSKGYYTRMINIVPNNKENAVKGYQGIASLETSMVAKQTENDARLTYLNRAESNYQKIIELDANNANAKNSLKWVQEYIASVKKGINPNEIKGKITDSTGKPISFASIRVKDTAAENLSKSNGEFKFEIPQGSEVLIISAQGYVTKEMPITATRTYNVTLEK